MRAKQYAVGGLCILVLVLPVSHGQLSQNCTVSVLNRNVQVNADGSWVLPNVPAGMGQVKARATCVENGVTRSGESAFMSIPANGAVNLPPISLGTVTQVPDGLTISPVNPVLTGVGQSLSLTVTAHYPDNTAKVVSTASGGTNYTSSNPAIATVGANGLVTAVSSGTVVIQAINDGTPAMTTVRVVLSGRDSDGDGIPDDVELILGLNPNDPVDGQEDFDRDELTNAQEYTAGTNLRNADTDNDGSKDGDEVNVYRTNPLVADSDGDLIPDGVEILTGTNPLNRASYDLRRAAASFSLSPPNFVLNTSTLFPLATQQLRFRVNLIDGKTTLDLTAKTTGTTYSSSNLNSCSFGVQDGLVFAGQPGTCTITASNSTLTVSSAGTITNVNPAPLSFVSIPGTAMNVKVSGNYAFVAAGTAGLVVVDVANRTIPKVVASLPMVGFANDVAISGNYAYVADGTGGLRLVNVANPLVPFLVATIGTGGDAQDVVVKGTFAFVAYSGTPSGMQIVDVTIPAQPSQVSFTNFGAPLQGVDYDTQRRIAVLAAGTSGFIIADVSNPAAPVRTGGISGGDVRDVTLSGTYVFLADVQRSFTSVDISNPSSPVIRASTPLTTGGRLVDIALSGTVAFGADIGFFNDVPIIDMSNPANPLAQLLLPFRQYRDDDATGIAVDPFYIYLTANTSDGRLYIGQYRQALDLGGVPPTVQITSPAPGTSIIRGSTFTVAATAADDVAVASVSFYADDISQGTDSTAPYEFAMVAPLSGNNLKLTASALDMGGNIGPSAPVIVNLIPDPLTTLTGRVIGPGGVAVAGATVQAVSLNRSVVTGLDGSFSIPGVSTISGDLSLFVLAVINGIAHLGTAGPLLPVRGGNTNFGTIVVSSCVAEPPGLVAFWPGEDNAVDVVGASNGVMVGGASFAAGKVGKAFRFDEQQPQAVFIPHDEGLNVAANQNFTIEGWVNLQNPTSGSADLIFSKLDQERARNGATTSAYEFLLDYDTHKVAYFEIGGDIHRAELRGNTPVPLNTWTHVAMVRENGIGKIYVNGVLDGTGALNNLAITNSDPAIIGGVYDTSISPPYQPRNGFGGLIDEVRFYGRAVTAAELQATVLAGRGVCQPATLFVDGFTGTSLDGTKWQALEADGTIRTTNGLLEIVNGGHKDLNTISTFGAGDVVASARVRVTGDYTKFGFNVNQIQSNGFYFDTYENAPNTITVLAYSNGTEVLRQALPMSWGECHDIAIRRSSSLVTFYIDGKQVAQLSGMSTAVMPVGVWNDRPPLTQVDRVRVLSAN